MATASGAPVGTARCASLEEQQVTAASKMRAGRSRKFVRALQVLAVTVAAAWVAPGGEAWAQAVSTVPRAGSSIGNQASATYTDGSGATRTATSNTVQTTVTQVAAVSLTQNQDVRGATGQPVYFPHVVSNTGNGIDSFLLSATENSANLTGPGGAALLQIFPDRNRDGRPDPGEPAITSTPNLQPGEDFAFVIAGEVPGNVTTGTAAVTVTATSALNSAITATNNDTLTVTGNAVVSIVKSVSASGGAPGSTGYNYTLSYTNNGNITSGPVVITDDIPAGLAYRAGSGFWSFGGVTLTDAAGDVQGPAPDTIDYSTAVSPIDPTRTRVSVTINRVQPGANFFVRFGFNAAAGAAPGPRNNTATFTYDDDAVAGTPPIAATTNTVPFNVTATGGVNGTGDTFGPAPQGSSFDFLNTFTNAGTGADTFDVTIAAPGTFPAGTSFLLLRAPAGTTRPVGTALIANAAPLVDTNGNRTPDTGQLAVGESVSVIVRVQLPPAASGAASTYTVNKTATSATTGSTVTVTDTLNGITPASIDLRNTDPNSATPVGAENGGTGAGTNTVINSYPATAGATTRIPLSVTNTAGQPDNYNLAFSSATLAGGAAPVALPPGYTLRFVDLNGAVITNTGNVPAGQTVRFFAEVVPPANAQPATLDIFFRATSATGGASDFLRDQIVVGTRRAIAIEPNNTGQTFSGSSITYSHALTNNGNVAEVVSLTTANTANFTTTNYVDVNNNGIIDAGDTVIASGGTVTVPAGGTVNILTRVFAPSDASPGTVNTTTLTATATGVIAGTTAPSDTATDTTTVVAGQLRLVKEQALDAANDGVADTAFSTANAAAAPGQALRYRITVTNIGTQPVSNIVITDATPGFTTYTIAGPATLTAPDNTTTAATVAPGNGGTGALRFEFATPLQPGQSVVATFGVRING